jgi:hypothetical protein
MFFYYYKDIYMITSFDDFEIKQWYKFDNGWNDWYLYKFPSGRWMMYDTASDSVDVHTTFAEEDITEGTNTINKIQSAPIGFVESFFDSLDYMLPFNQEDERHVAEIIFPLFF